MRLFYASGCPFAHRTRALLTHLEQHYEAREIDLTAKPGDFLALSPTGRVPLLDDGGFLLYESMVINEYLGERFAWQGFSPDVRARARERLAMLQFDQVLVPGVIACLKAPGNEISLAVGREIDELAHTAEAKPVASLLGFHIAPHWLRWSWVAPHVPIVRRLRAAKSLGGWLDEAAAQAPIQTTAPDRDETLRRMRKMLGLPPPTTDG